ncbi:hypothetical protein [Paenibacillus cremeus]|uniref:YtxH domain-containing protein n=1 Tax=Paenibacillus cremeus TaxID=2163881 RepID=A0A559KE83_9BACL|nr:hypothetical protein [Paenibacillus cremeus]TVY10431.1 hypothetical protein FPZ49_08530 [Paenibacillus cremeus]
MLKSRAGYLLGAAALMLLLSPTVRKAVRSWAVKGVGAALDVTDQVKGFGDSIRSSANTNEMEMEKGNRMV